jgi:acetoin:2,6-dichlorophenolindophenol oxidoreductase subunit alpha
MDDKTRRELYRVMVLSRTYEEAILREYHADKKPAFDIGAGLVPGEMHLSAGQEPVAAGVCAHLRRDDAVTATHRPHHLAIAHGVDLDKMTAEIFGREGGLGHGRGGHMHLFDPAVHFSCSGIVAEGLPPALGQAFAFQRRGSNAVAVAVTGEGAANQGAFHESVNLAALWKLPVVFVVEDNDWAISVPRAASTAIASNADRAAGYGIPGQRIEDNDVEAIYTAAGDAVARARAGEGPTLLEVHTLRMWGHFEGDPQVYRPELAEVPARDPIPAYEARLIEAGVLDASAISAIRKEASARVEKAIEFAKSSPVPAPETARDYVFA